MYTQLLALYGDRSAKRKHKKRNRLGNDAELSGNWWNNLNKGLADFDRKTRGMTKYLIPGVAELEALKNLNKKTHGLSNYLIPGVAEMQAIKGLNRRKRAVVRQPHLQRRSPRLGNDEIAGGLNPFQKFFRKVDKGLANIDKSTGYFMGNAAKGIVSAPMNAFAPGSADLFFKGAKGLQNAFGKVDLKFNAAKAQSAIDKIGNAVVDSTYKPRAMIKQATSKQSLKKLMEPAVLIPSGIGVAGLITVLALRKKKK